MKTNVIVKITKYTVFGAIVVIYLRKNTPGRYKTTTELSEAVVCDEFDEDLFMRELTSAAGAPTVELSYIKVLSETDVNGMAEL